LTVPQELEEATRRYRAGDIAGAAALCARALAAAPESDAALHLAGVVALRRGEVDRACDLLAQAAALAPDNPAYSFAHAEALRAAVNTDAAVAAYHQALALDPGIVPAYTHLGMIALAAGRRGEAVETLRRATAYAPGDDAAWARLGTALQDSGDLDGAIAAFARALRCDPTNVGYADLFVAALNAYPLPFVPPAALAELHACYVDETVDQQALALAAAAAFKRDERFLGLAAMSAADDPSALAAAIAGEVFDDLFRDPLLLGLLSQSLVADEAFVQVLTAVRRAILEQSSEGRPPEELLVSRRPQFVTALAMQCFLGGYAWFETRAESATAGYLVAEVRRGLDALGTGNDAAAWDAEMWYRLMVLATYRPLFRIENAPRLLDLGLPAQAPFRRRLLVQQLAQPTRERALLPTLERIGGEGTAVAEAPPPSPDSPDATPYPRWLRLPPIVAAPLGTALGEILPPAAVPDFGAGRKQALMVGCGTGRRAVRLALRAEDTDVLAIDARPVDLAFAARLAEEQKAANIRFAVAAPVAVASLEPVYHLIDTCDALVERADPREVLAACAGRLAPNGLIRFEVRSASNMEGVVAARELVRERGLAADVDGLREARRAVLALPAAHPARAFTRSAGFYVLGQCRDMLFPRGDERQYTVADVGELLAACGLAFVAYEVIRPGVIAAFTEQFGAGSNPANLGQWAELYARRPGLFSTTHAVWCRRLSG
jgi:predicted TPR repeat methyltransferase